MSARAAIALACLLAGCKYSGPESAYQRHYAAHIEGVAVPSAAEIEAGGVSRSYPAGVERVWEACLDVATQYEGILGLERDADGTRRLLVVHGVPWMYDVPFMRARQDRGKERVVVKFVDVWIAVSIRGDVQGVRVSAAAVSPRDGAVEPLAGGYVAASAAPADLFEGLDADRLALSSRMGRAREDEGRKGALAYAPQVTLDSFFYDLACQATGAERWTAKFLAGEDAPVPVDAAAFRAVAGSAIESEVRDDPAGERRLALEAGRWSSANLRRSLVVLDCPDLHERLEGMAARLWRASDGGRPVGDLYIVASPSVNAWSTANGDVFVCSALLERLDNLDQVAGVLAHELDHVLQDDSLHRLQQFRDAENTATVIQAVAGAAASLAGPMVVGPGASTAGNLAAQLTSNVVEAGIRTMGAAVVNAASSSMVTGYSSEQELRADANAVRYMARAGYNPQGMVTLLETLEDVRDEYTARGATAVSGFINCKPGIEQRLADLGVAER